MKESYDTVVVGGGPAGSTAAALVAKAGFSTLLVEREKLPRYHVGESLMPETYRTLKRLGVLEQMKNSNFVRKASFQFVSETGKQSRPFVFTDHDPRECSVTWQVERAAFDKLLFDNAAAKGADCYDQTRVLDVLLEGQRACGVRLLAAGGRTVEVRSPVVIDATGQQALLANRLGVKVDDPGLKNEAAVWGYYRNARRNPGEHNGGTIILRTKSKQSWFWFIPLSNEITSIGVVGDLDYLLKDRGRLADVYEDELVRCPALVERLMDAEMVGELRVIKDFIHTTSQHAGDGWVLVGDAFGFLDPIYSSGVFFALRSGELAADAVVEGLSNNDTSGEQLGRWTDDFKAGVRLIRKLVAAFYTHEFSFDSFLKNYPMHHANLTDLLIGRVFYEGAERIFDDMDPAIERAKQAAREEHSVEA